jgi:hypothetical protein
MMKLLHEFAKIVRQARAVAADLRRWRPEKEN